MILFPPCPPTHHVVHAGIRRGVCDRLEGGPGAVGVGGRRHFPGEVNLSLVDARLLAALLHHRVFGVMGVAGGDAHQRVTWRGSLLTALLRHFLDVIVVSKRNHLGTKEDVIQFIFFFILLFLITRWSRVVWWVEHKHCTYHHIIF